MMWLKACPRCSGDLFADWDPNGGQMACLQCGHSLSRAETDLVKTRLASRARRTVAERQRELVATQPESSVERVARVRTMESSTE